MTPAERRQYVLGVLSAMDHLRLPPEAVAEVCRSLRVRPEELLEATKHGETGQEGVGSGGSA